MSHQIGEFGKHWPVLSFRKSDAFSIVHNRMTRCSIFESYLSLLGESLDKHGLRDDTAQIYNCDESGMPMEHKSPKTIALYEQRFMNGYGIYADENYVAWLNKSHPGFALSIAESFTSVPPLNKTSFGDKSGGQLIALKLAN